MNPMMLDTDQLFKMLDQYAACLPPQLIAALRLMDEMGIKPTTIEPAAVSIYQSFKAVDAELRRRGVLK